MIKNQIQKLVIEAVKKLYPDLKNLEIKIEYPRDKSHGDYACATPLQLAKILKSDPIQIANAIKTEILKNKDPFRREYLKKNGGIDIKAPGFINFRLHPLALIKNDLFEILEKKAQYGHSNIGQGKKVIIEYSDPNIAKPLGIHHILGTIIGQALSNLYRTSGFAVTAWNYIGDWGTQFGKLLYACKKWGELKKIEQNPIPELLELYVKFHFEAEKNPTLEDEGRKEFQKLEAGDLKNRKLWQWFVDVSLKDIEKTYALLENIHFDLIRGESYYQNKMQPIIDEGLKNGVFKVGKEGAIVAEFPDQKYPTCIVQKADGATIYHTRDLAMIDDRLENFHPEKILYVVDVAQKLHFEQLFEMASMLGRDIKGFEHLIFGRMNFPEARMSTRKGNVVLLEDVLHEAIDRAAEIVQQKNPDLPDNEKTQISRKVGIGAVKYSVLSQNRTTNITFTWEKMLSLDGNSAPYLQYTYARARNILREDIKEEMENKLSASERDDIQYLNSLIAAKLPKLINAAKKEHYLIGGSWTNNLLRLFPKYCEHLILCVAENKPNLLSAYLYELAQIFNDFYNHVRVLNPHIGTKEEHQKARHILLLIVHATTLILKNGLEMLGIDLPERM